MSRSHLIRDIKKKPGRQPLLTVGAFFLLFPEHICQEDMNLTKLVQVILSRVEGMKEVYGPDSSVG